MIPIALAVAPGIAICLYIFYKDIYNREPKINLFICFLIGAVAIIPAAQIERYFMPMVPIGTRANAFVFAFLVVALTEELCKFMGLRLYAYRLKSFDEPLDGIVYSLMISMGFATVENILYVIRFSEYGMGYQVAFRRMFMSVPAHAFFAVIMGYFVGKAKFANRNRIYLLMVAIILATFFHGTYDFFLFLKEFSLADKQVSDWLLLSGAILSLIIALILSKRLLKQHRDHSATLFHQNNNPDNA